MGRLLFRITEFIITSREAILRFLNRSLVYLSLFALLSVVLEHGFEVSNRMALISHMIQALALLLFALSQSLRYMVEPDRRGRRRDLILGIVAISIVVMFRFFQGPLSVFVPVNVQTFFLHGFIFILFVTELGNALSNMQVLYVNPAFLFALSFLVLILIGAGLLMMPKSSTEGVSFIDALFTSTSAVCVTGLSTVNVETTFTVTGQVIVLMLIQLGGLGVMTFTTFFGYFFQGSASYRNRLVMMDYLSENQVGKVFHTLMRVVGLTFLIETLGGLAVYISVGNLDFATPFDRVFFSVFHSISAFCNAGFSTLGDGLYDLSLRYNYALHIIIALLIILGGIGFPVMFNFLQIVSFRTQQRLRRMMRRPLLPAQPRIIRLNTRLALMTTLVLLVAGTVIFYFLEQDGILKHLDPMGQWVTAFFASVTPRTAGYNTFNTLSMTIPTLMVMMLLMWIGASPASTGGGIKTTTFAVALATILNVARGRNRVEIRRRTISQDTVHKAFIAIFLSLLIIGVSTFLLTIFEHESLTTGKTFTDRLAFESFSAYGTVGLTVGVTPILTTAGKYTLVVVMFLGRVGTLTLITALVRKVTTLKYSYPEENILVG